MDQFDLMDKHDKEFAAFAENRIASYEQLKRSVIRLMFKLCQTRDYTFIESASVIIAVVQTWEEEWGFSGKRRNALLDRQAQEWHDLKEYKRMLREFEYKLSLMKN